MTRELRTALTALLFLAVPGIALAGGKKARSLEGTRPTQDTAAEDKEIISNLEVLEKYDLLKDMDAIRYFPLLGDMKEEEGEKK